MVDLTPDHPTARGVEGALERRYSKVGEKLSAWDVREGYKVCEDGGFGGLCG